MGVPRVRELSMRDCNSVFARNWENTCRESRGLWESAAFALHSQQHQTHPGLSVGLSVCAELLHVPGKLQTSLLAFYKMLSVIEEVKSPRKRTLIKLQGGAFQKEGGFWVTAISSKEGISTLWAPQWVTVLQNVHWSCSVSSPSLGNCPEEETPPRSRDCGNQVSLMSSKSLSRDVNIHMGQAG